MGNNKAKMSYKDWYNSLIKTLAKLIPVPLLLWFGKVFVDEGENIGDTTLIFIGRIIMLLACCMAFLTFIMVNQLYSIKPEEEDI